MWNLVLVAAMVVASLWTVMTGRLLRAVVGLAITSVILTIIMFQLKSPLAAVFELSICAGLIPAIFLSVVSLTRRLSVEDQLGATRKQLRRFWVLPVLVFLVGLVLLKMLPAVQASVGPAGESDVRKVLWQTRPADVLGQVVILMLAGAFGVVTLLKESRPKEESKQQ